MLNGQWRRAIVIALGVLAAVALLPDTEGTGRAQTPATSERESLSAWEEIATVLQHPRCLNCHQLDAPLQGDARRIHVPRVVRGPDGQGVSAMRCGNCHNDLGNNPTSGAPGGPHWQLAPVSMLWQGLSVGDLCRMLKNPKLNGNRTPEALVEHMESEPLVLWGWNPGRGREAVPMPHGEFVNLMKVWIAGGTVCPE
jgi:mono/diheme cytochrome c family protein